MMTENRHEFIASEIERAYVNADEGWKEEYYTNAANYLAENHYIEGGDICAYCRAQGMSNPHHHNVWGAMITSLQKLGWIEKVGMVQPTTKHTHINAVCQWESKVFKVSIAPWSFSKIKAFEQCPKQFYHEKILKEYPVEETEAMLYGTMFHTAAEEYIRGCTPMPVRFHYAVGALDSLQAKQGKKLCEYKLGLTKDLEPCGFSDPDVWFRGIADLIILDGDMAWVIDYKTGKSARYADKGQLELMALATFKHFPEVQKIRAGLLFVVSRDLIKDTYTKDSEDALWHKWLTNYEKMEAAVENNVWNPRPSGLCKRHCAVTECVHNGRN